MNEDRFTLSILVANKYGVLTRVSGLFSKRGYNIDSLHVGPVEGTDCSNIILTSRGEPCIKEQIIKQLLKLHDVKKVDLMPNLHL